MVGTQFKVWVLLTAAFCMGACAHHTVVVKCDGKLDPINLPEPKNSGTKPDATALPHSP
jgi:hypothetical protein